MTWGYDDIEAGRAVLWPPRARRVQEHISGAQEPIDVYDIDGDEYWCNSDDGNLYATVFHPAVAERIVACWNAFLGVPTDQIPADRSAKEDGRAT